MLSLFFLFILLHHIGSLSGDLSAVLQSVTPLNSVAINITWVIVSSGQSNSTADGTIKLEIDVCGISSSYITVLPPQNANSINVQQSMTVSPLQPDSVYHACLGANWTSANNMSYSIQYPCTLVRTYMADNTTLNPIPSILHVIWQQLWNMSTPTVYVDVMLARVLAISPWAKVQFGSQPVVQANINTPLNDMYLMNRFVFANLSTPPQVYNLQTTVYLLAAGGQCALVGEGYIDTRVVQTTLSNSNNTNSGERVSTLCWGTLILSIGLLYYDL